MANRTLLITGFEPFHQETINPSWEAVAALPETIGPWKLEKLRLPVVFGQAAELVLAHTEKIHPDVILSVGQAGGRDASGGTRWVFCNRPCAQDGRCRTRKAHPL